MESLWVLAIATLVLFVPGAIVLLAARVRRASWIAGVAPPISCGIASLTAMGCALIGVPFGPVPLCVVVGLVALVGVGVWWRSPREPSTGPRRRPVELVGAVCGVVLVVGAIAAGTRSWLAGMGSLRTVPQEHDMVVHTTLTAFIERTGRGAPWQLLPADLLTGAPAQPYPAGLHLLSAIVARCAGDAVVGLNAVAVVVCAVVWPVSVATLGVMAARRARMGFGIAMVAGGMAAVVAIGLQQPMFLLNHVGGMLPNATALAMAPGILTVLVTMAPAVGPVLVAGLACAGAVAVHPSAGVTVGVSVVAWCAGELFTRGGAGFAKDRVRAVGAAVVVAAVMSLPGLAAVLSQRATVTTFPSEKPPESVTQAMGRVFAVPYDGFPGDVVPLGSGQFAVMLLLLAGLVAILVRGGPWGLVAAWGAWAVVVVAMYVSPGRGWEAGITRYFYNATFRISSHLNLFVPVIAALGVVFTAAVVARRLPRLPSLRPSAGRWAAVGLVMVLAAVYGMAVLPGYLRIAQSTVASRFSSPTPYVRVSPDDLAAIRWLAPRVLPGQRVLNSANDGSTYLYVLGGVPVVNVLTLGAAAWPPSYALLEDFNRYRTESDIRRALTDLDVAWIYVDTKTPTISSAGAPENWVSAPSFGLAPGLLNLEALPEVRPAFRSGTVAVYSVDLNAIRALDAGPPAGRPPVVVNSTR
ncbi:DUF6541 family protein [Saccharopolyspora endophytica]|uniref:DUF6541 family protein n=1 Tax=Saccharopolyspora endophytica TaxID=543886 RepID=UPI001B394795|nr:DUF6541 family protein [Saccharopolyspora endophytica]